MNKQITIEQAFVLANESYEDEKAAADAYRNAAIALIDHIAEEAVNNCRSDREKRIEEAQLFDDEPPSDLTH